MEITIPTMLLTRGAEVALGGGLTVLTVYSLTRPLEKRVAALERLPEAVGRELGRLYNATQESVQKIDQALAAVEAAHSNALGQQQDLIAAVQQAQVQLATSDQQQEAALVDLGERISRQSEVLGRMIEQMQQRPAPAPPAPDPWEAPELQQRIASLRQQFTERRANAAQAFSAPTPEEAQ